MRLISSIYFFVLCFYISVNKGGVDYSFWDINFNVVS